MALYALTQTELALEEPRTTVDQWQTLHYQQALINPSRLPFVQGPELRDPEIRIRPCFVTETTSSIMYNYMFNASSPRRLCLRLCVLVAWVVSL